MALTMIQLPFRCAYALKVLVPVHSKHNISAITKRFFITGKKSHGRGATLWEPDRKSGNKVGKEDELSTIEHVKRGSKLLIPEIKKILHETKEHFAEDNLLRYQVPDKKVEKFFDFKEPDSAEMWQTTADSEVDLGYSTASFRITPMGTCCFSGNLSTDVPRTGEVKRAGYANLRLIPELKSFKRVKPIVWVQYTHLALRLRGDGRTYMINLHPINAFDVTWMDIYSYVLHTRGGPYWQETQIPFSKFYLNHKGRIQDTQDSIDLANIQTMSITLSDQNDGHFNLELDYIGCVYNPEHEEEFAYETYYVPRWSGYN